MIKKTQQTYTSQYFEIYKIAVEMADRTSARRTTTNTFFLSLHSALVVLSEKLNLVSVAFLGIIFSIAWWMSLKSYRDLNSAKYKVIQNMETRLSASPFKDEWDILKKDPIKSWKKRYAELGQVEQVVPIFLGLFYLGIIMNYFHLFIPLLSYVLHK